MAGTCRQCLLMTQSGLQTNGRVQWLSLAGGHRMFSRLSLFWSRGHESLDHVLGFGLQVLDPGIGSIKGWQRVGKTPPKLTNQMRRNLSYVRSSSVSIGFTTDTLQRQTLRMRSFCKPLFAGSSSKSKPWFAFAVCPSGSTVSTWDHHGLAAAVAAAGRRVDWRRRLPAYIRPMLKNTNLGGRPLRLRCGRQWSLFDDAAFDNEEVVQKVDRMGVIRLRQQDRNAFALEIADNFGQPLR